MRYRYNIMFIISFLQNPSAIWESEALVIEEEGGSRTPKIIDYSLKQDFLCSIGSACIPLSDCHIMAQLLKRSCLQTDKLRGLTCGSRGHEPLVCCPQTCQALPPPQPAPPGSQCGRPQLSNWWATNYYGLGSHPWVVRVGFKNILTNGIDYLCCGSIINKRTILTAAHCALAKSSTHKIVSVKVGEYDHGQEPDCTYGYCAQTALDVPLNHIVVHPNYDSKTFANNIALLILKYPLNYSVSIQPICTYKKDSNYIFVGHKAKLVGWGKISSQSNALTNQQWLDLPVQPLETCSLLYGPSVPITDTELCVGGEGKDACSGFGGAPLVILDPNSRSCYYQIGLLSFGSDQCGLEGIPSVYTRVDKYSDWIELNSPKVS